MNSAPYLETAEAVLAGLGSDPARGLTSTEAAARLRQFGPNALAAEPSPPAWRRFVAQFQNPLVALLLVAAVISSGVWLLERDSELPFETLTILVILLANAVLGFIQEARAEQAVAALRRMTAATATVLRDGQRQKILASQVVPGDILLIEEGDAIAADGRVIEAIGLQVSEAALTGESLPVSKCVEPLGEAAGLGDRRNMVFAGTVVTYGRGRAVVTATGMHTEVGRIAGLLQRTEDEATPLQAEIARVGRTLGAVVIAIAALIVVTVLLTSPAITSRVVVDALVIGVSLAVAAVPEGLAAILTIVLALGMQRMARRNVIVRRLAAVETLGSANVICTDKTGTLTRNEMTARCLITASGQVTFTGSGYAPHGEVLAADGRPLATDSPLYAEVVLALRAAALANNSALQVHGDRWSIQGDPTEGALRVAAAKLSLSLEALEHEMPRLGELPFSAERKRMSTLHVDPHHADQMLVFAKGAPDVLLALCCAEQVGADVHPLSEARRRQILATVDGLADQALRTIGVAYRRMPRQPGLPAEAIEHNLTFLGVFGLLDPPRPEAKAAVARAMQAGIRVIMITGDHPRTAAAIAAELDIAPPGARVITGAALESLDDSTLARLVRDVSVYARVSPEHKLRLVQAFRQHGDVVAMTGDGVNDAPALKQADIGIAMGITGTDVAKEAADMILTDDNFASIVAAVEEGRAIFSNIRKFLRYLLSSNIGEVLTMFLGLLFASSLMGMPALPLLAVQILWINLVTDSGPALALGVDPPAPHLMRRPPRPRGQGVIDRAMWAGLLLVGITMAIGTLLMFDYGLPGGLIAGSGDVTYARTLAFTTLVLFQLFNVFSARSDREGAWTALFSNRWLWAAVLLSLAMQVAVVYLPALQRAFQTTPLAAGDWLACALVASSVVWVREGSKALMRRITAAR
jgi:P-type Ca2+ transporter type 2C